MSKGFVQFVAKGYIYEHDQKTGKPTKVKDIRHGTGVVKSGPDMMGKIFRQCAELLPCHAVTVDTYTI